MYKIFKFFLLIIFKLTFFTQLAFSANEKIKVGLLVPITGDDQNLGKQIIKSVRIALKDINTNKLEVYISKKIAGKKREPIKYIATGNVEFKIFSNGKEYEGKGKKVIYRPKNLQYSIFGDGYLKEKTEDKTLYGDEILISQKTGEAQIKGSAEKPVRFILNIDNKKEETTKEETKKDPTKCE